jgi:hypothetical protein
MGEENSATELHRIGDLIDEAIHQPRPLPERPPPRFLSGRWHARDGTVYSRVAEVGSPNAGNIHGNNPPRSL